MIDEQDEALIFFLLVKFPIRFITWAEILKMYRDFSGDYFSSGFLKNNSEMLVSGSYMTVSLSRGPDGKLNNPFRVSAIKSLKTKKLYYYMFPESLSNRTSCDVFCASEEFQKEHHYGG